MRSYPKVSLLMLNWNGINFTKKSVRALLKTDYPNFELILLDNGSLDNEGKKLAKLFKGKIKVIIVAKNLGYAAGMNKAYEHARGKFIMFLNNDMTFPKGWLNPLVEKLMSDNTIGACQPKVRDLRAKTSFEYAAAAGGFVDIFGYPFARGRIFSSVEKDKGQYEDSILIAWGGVLLVRKSVLEKIGVFDPIFFNYAEDVDLCYRLYRSGYKIVYVPTSIVYHYGGGVLGKNLSRKMFFIHRNHVILLLKNWPYKTLFVILLPRFLMDIASFFYYFTTGYSNISLAMIRAYVSLLFMLPKIYNSRKRLRFLQFQNKTKMPIYNGSIVIDYFLKGKRKYGDIINNKISQMA